MFGLFGYGLVVKQLGGLLAALTYNDLKKIVDTEFERATGTPSEASEAAQYIDHYVHMHLKAAGISGQAILDRIHTDVVYGHLETISRLLTEGKGFAADKMSVGLQWW